MTSGCLLQALGSGKVDDITCVVLVVPPGPTTNPSASPDTDAAQQQACDAPDGSNAAAAVGYWCDGAGGAADGTSARDDVPLLLTSAESSEASGDARVTPAVVEAASAEGEEASAAAAGGAAAAAVAVPPAMVPLTPPPWRQPGVITWDKLVRCSRVGAAWSRGANQVQQQQVVVGAEAGEGGECSQECEEQWWGQGAAQAEGAGGWDCGWGEAEAQWATGGWGAAAAEQQDELQQWGGEGQGGWGEWDQGGRQDAPPPGAWTRPTGWGQGAPQDGQQQVQSAGWAGQGQMQDGQQQVPGVEWAGQTEEGTGCGLL